MIPGLLSGGLLLLASPALGLWPLTLVAYLPLLAGLERRFHQNRLGWWQAIGNGYLVGLLHAGSLFFWIITLNGWALFPVVLIYALLDASLAAALLFGLRRGLRGGWLAAWVLCFWLASEALVSDRFLELPPYGLGYYLWEAPALIQLADLGGAYAVSLLVMAVNLLLARLWLDGVKQAFAWLAGTAALLVATLGYGLISADRLASKLEQEKSLRVLSLHTRVAPEQKHDPEQIRAMFDRFATLTRSAVAETGQPELIIWPETSVPVWLRSPAQRDMVQGLLSIAATTQAPLLIGAHSLRAVEGGTAVYNTAFLVPARGYIAQEYHKVLLAPGVEKTPLATLLPETLSRRWPSRLTAGGDPVLIHPERDIALGSFICWEAFFPGHVSQLVRQGGQLLANLSNDEAAFGSLQAAYSIPLPHLAFRAVENRRWLVRSANAGPALLVAPDGRVMAQSTLFEEGGLPGTVGLRNELTLYTRHGRHLPVLLIGLAALWGGWLTIRPRRQEGVPHPASSRG